MDSFRLAVIGIACCVVLFARVVAGRSGGDPPIRQQLDRWMDQGNFKEALEGYRALALDPATQEGLVGHALSGALHCLRQLGRVDEVDDFREAVIERQASRWRVMRAAAASYLDDPHKFGFLIGGRFVRGPHRGGTGRFVSSVERDRACALQLLIGALDRAMSDEDHAATGQYLRSLASALLFSRTGGEAWRLQVLTSIETLPDFQEQERWRWAPETSRAPVEPDGTPVYYSVPETWQKARNDGERWRWALAHAAERDATQLNRSRYELAAFLRSQFGTQTLRGLGTPVPLPPGAQGRGGPFELESLSDDETIALLATGVKRFQLPGEFNFIRLFQQIADDPRSSFGEEALGELAGIFEDRRQYARAVETLERSRREYGDRDQIKQRRIDQIQGNWGQFEPTMTQPAGRGATVDFRFRNGRKVSFEAHEILLDRLLRDIEGYLEGMPPRIDPQQIDLNDIGRRIVARGERQYLGRRVAAWELELEPAAGHLDRRITVATPLQKAGVYLLVARMQGGNTSRIVVWLDDTVIVRKPMPQHAFYFVADARSGQPLAAAIDLLGWRIRHEADRNVFKVETRRLRRQSDTHGQLLVPISELEGEGGDPFHWLASATTPEGRLAFLGFMNIWKVDPPQDEYDQVKVVAITDRPVYRPGSQVRYKIWIASARYDQPQASEFAGQRFSVELHDPQGNKVTAANHSADTYGGFDGSFELPSDAPLGVYQIWIPGRGGGAFRVEEYKKPEFEVKVEAPPKPARLGEKVALSIKAAYYFGGPVAEGRVRYKITRTIADDRWYPVAPWDWLYGPGSWWFAPDSSWYPGWERWGVARPSASWWGRPGGPPEIVAEAELPLLPHGTLPLEIDTAIAQAMHPTEDHRYEIRAEVTDLSRRTVVGTGTVQVARDPFKVYTWVDRGHYRSGDTISVSVRALTPDRRPVRGNGTLTLLAVRFDDQGNPLETPLERWELQLDDEGQTQLSIKAGAPGQYRLAAKIDDGAGHVQEGGYLLTITGDHFAGSGFRFNDLELIPDRREYRPGESLKLLINTNQANSAVLLFVRPIGGLYQPPRLIRMVGRSLVETIPVGLSDMPNFFVEAVTVSQGKVHVETREIAVPPATRVIDVSVRPAQEVCRPGQTAKVAVKLAGEDGRPVRGSTVIAVYDKAVESISGGSNVPDLRELFWSSRRYHFPQTDSSLSRWFWNVLKPDETPMQPLESLAEGTWGFAETRAALALSRQSGGGGIGDRAGGMGGGELLAMESMSPMAAAAGVEAEAAGTMAVAGPSRRKGPDDGGSAVAEPAVRVNFADTAFWAAALEADESGMAEVEFPLPESLTAWRVKAWTMGAGTRVGQSEAELVTTKNLLIRPQGPRFVVEGDEVVISAIVHNKLERRKAVRVVLELEGSVLEAQGPTIREIEIEAGREQRVDWRAQVVREGQAVVRMKALTDEESDAAQWSFPAYVHGMVRMAVVSGAIRPEGHEAQVVLRVPERRRADQTRLVVQYSPSLAGAMVDALPFLAAYPYGCTEQTLNRFLPTVITQRVLLDLGIDLKAVRDRRASLNAQELDGRLDRSRSIRNPAANPVFDPAEVARMAQAGIRRLADMQLSDGGWGWFSGSGESSSPHTTALVVHGLQLARQNDLALPEGMIERGLAWLSEYQARQVQLLANAVSEQKPLKPAADDIDALVMMVLADADVRNDRMLEFLDRDRLSLSVYARALLGLAYHRLGDRQRLGAVVDNIRQYVVEDEENQTAYLRLPNEGSWWVWHGSETETHAFFLKLLNRTDPRGQLASRLATYLVNNRRRGTSWDSTRDTAYAVEALAEYLKASGEDRPDLSGSIALDGRLRKEIRITPADLFSFDNRLVIEGNELSSGDRVVTLGKRGNGPLYYSASLTTFTLEEPIPRAGFEVKVDRKAYRLVRDDRMAEAPGGRGQAVLERRERYRRELLESDAQLQSGELVEVELEIESKNDYEYLVVEDFKAAGFEPIEVRSGYTDNDLHAYVEFRDDRVAFFVRTLARGRQSVSYRLRAEIPGRFHALPARVMAMYAPELRGNSDEIRLKIAD